MGASRELFWNIPSWARFWFYGLATFSVLALAFGTWNRASIWARGEDKDGGRLDGLTVPSLLLLSLRRFFSLDCVRTNRALPVSRWRGAMILSFIWGFFILFLGTVSETVDHYFVRFLIGRPYLVLALVLDLAGLVLLLGLVVATFRRYVFTAKRQVISLEDSLILGSLLAIVLFGFGLEGIRLAVFAPPGLDWSPVGGLLSIGLRSLFDRAQLLWVYRPLWAAHFLLAFFFVGYIPFSKQWHMFAGQLSAYAAQDNWRDHW